MLPSRQPPEPFAAHTISQTFLDSRWDEDDIEFVKELEGVARRLYASPRWQAYYRKVVERLRIDWQLTLENQMAMALTESPDHFLVLLKMLTDQHHLSRTQVRSFIDAKSDRISPTVFRNSLRLYRRLFLRERRHHK